jgi:glutamate synthase (NADPH/NADH) small chain
VKEKYLVIWLFLAMGFCTYLNILVIVNNLDVALDERGNVKATEKDYQTSIAKIFAAGDSRRGQSLVVWAIKEGRDCAKSVDEFLTGKSLLETADGNAIARYL